MSGAMTSTMVGIAALLLAGFAFEAARRRWFAAGPRTAQAQPAMLTVQVQRGSVHASDDAPARQIMVPAGAALRDAVDAAMSGAYLPGISGGKATWVVESSCNGSITPIAVVAQQWQAPAYLVPADEPSARHFACAVPALTFSYLRQDDPGAVQRSTVQAPAPRPGTPLQVRSPTVPGA